MKILLISGTLWPQPGNNANIVQKLLPHLCRHHTVHILAPAGQQDGLPQSVGGIPVHWMTDDHRDPIRTILIPAIARCVDRGGFSDALQAMLLVREAVRIRRKFPFDAVLSTMEPYPSGLAAALVPFRCKRILYLMDPPGCVCDAKNNTPFRQRWLKRVFSRMDLVLTTPFIRKALLEHGFDAPESKFEEVGFPMVDKHPYAPTAGDIPMDREQINLLFTGWLCSDIRSPRYFLDIAEKLDGRFCITFMGKECDSLRERFSFETKAEVRTYPQQPYQTALNAMHDADILINIGNSVPVHMPSKTLEYINAGKPMVNFYKMTDCPTLHYTKRYPLCLNLYEGDPVNVQMIDQFIRFCADQKGKTASASDLPECTPEYIARIICDHLQT